jgi:5'-methylthioadenosine phosphorylase
MFNRIKGDSLIGIIGGTGMSSILNRGKEKIITTKYGKSKVLIDDENDTVLLFRHGLKHNTPPHKINYRANLYALKELGVDRILAINSVGSLKEHIKPGTFFVPNDFIEFTKARDGTFYDGEDGIVVHIDVSEPYCPDIVRVLKKFMDKQKYEYNEGVYVCTEGPRFETKAEINFYKTVGDVVGMTGYPEVVLARELGLCYASLCSVSNYCTGISKHKLTINEVFDTVKKMEENIISIVEYFINCDYQKSCNCAEALKDATIK